MPNHTRAKGASTDQANPATSYNAVLDAIAALRTDLTSELTTLKDDICASVDAKIDSLAAFLRSEITSLRTEIHGNLVAVRSEAGALASRVTELEKGTNHWADEATSLEIKLQNLIKQVASLSEKCEDLEGRSCRNNLRIIGLREGAEGPRPTDFIADPLHDALQLEERPLLDRAHRFLQLRPQPGERPRPFIV